MRILNFHEYYREVNLFDRVIGVLGGRTVFLGRCHLFRPRSDVGRVFIGIWRNFGWGVLKREKCPLMISLHKFLNRDHLFNGLQEEFLLIAHPILLLHDPLFELFLHKFTTIRSLTISLSCFCLIFSVSALKMSGSSSTSSWASSSWTSGIIGLFGLKNI